MTNLLKETNLLNFNHDKIQELINVKGWKQLDEYNKIGEIYQFVKDDIPFGYNKRDDLTAAAVLLDGYGQCNTKATLLMALFRAVNIKCRLHGFTIFKALQKGAIPNLLQWLAPNRIIHSWVEVKFENRWVNLEGFIIDGQYLKSVQNNIANKAEKRFIGYGIATENITDPETNWHGEDTYIQKEGLADDFGLFSDPDSFYLKHGTNLTGLKKWLYQYLIRHIMNANVARIRSKSTLH